MCEVVSTQTNQTKTKQNKTKQALSFPMYSPAIYIKQLLSILSLETMNSIAILLQCCLCYVEGTSKWV